MLTGLAAAASGYSEAFVLSIVLPVAGVLAVGLLVRAGADELPATPGGPAVAPA